MTMTMTAVRTVSARARRVPHLAVFFKSLNERQAMIRRTNSVTKLKITYVKDSYLDVSPAYSMLHRMLIARLGQSALQGLYV